MSLPITAPGTALDPGELALWLLQRIEPDLGVANVAVALRSDQAWRWWPLAEAMRWLLHRHAALCTSFPERDGLPVRERHDPDRLTFDVDVFPSTPDTVDDDLRAYAARPFNLATAPLVRAGQCNLPGGETVLCLVAHHIVMDAHSLATLFRELDAGYRHVVESGEPPDLPATAAAVRPAPSDRSLRYWRDTIAGFDPSGMRLLPAREHTGPPDFAGDVTGRFLSAAANEAVTLLRDRCRATDAIVLLAAYYVLLLRHGASEDLVIGVMANTRRAGRGSGVGYHVSTLPLRLRIGADDTMADVVAHVTTALVGGLDHADVPFELVAADLPVRPDQVAADGQDWWRSRLVRHLFNFRQSLAAEPAGQPQARRSAASATGERPVDPNWSGLTDVHTGLTRFDLELTVERVAGDLSVRLAHTTRTYGTGFAFDLVARLDALLVAAGAAPDEPVADLDLWSDHDRAVVARANATARPAAGTVLERCLAAADPASPAIVDDGTATSYARLWRRAAAVRDVVRGTLGQDARGAVVGVAGPRGAGLAAAVLGVWAAGAAYLPLEPDHPVERLAFELDDAGCRLVLDGDRLPEPCRDGRTCVPVPDSAEASLVDDPPVLDQADLAYVIYTSGSTGRPKGVELTHGNLANVVDHFATDLAVPPGTGMLWLTTFAFDISALELCLPLAVGGRVITAPDEARTDPTRLLSLVEGHDATVVQATPTTWRLVAPHAAGRLAGRTVLCGGEPLSPVLAEQLVATGARVVNVYGPTETTIWSTAADIHDDHVTVGRPIANTVVQVLDARGNALPPGLPGELCIAGAGVARGYLHRPELTADRFRGDPLLGRHYHTGDIARWRRDGRLVLLGRADRQIKLRAHRIEPGEVELALERHAEVAAAAVVLAGDQGEADLAAFVVAADRPGLADDLWRHAAGILPAYAVPARITAVPTLPQTANGKVDIVALARRAAELPGPAAGAPDPPTGPAVALVELWRTLLHKDHLDEHANFFLSGGTSLLAVRLAELAGAALGGPVTLGMVFRAPTPAALAALVSGGAA